MKRRRGSGDDLALRVQVVGDVFGRIWLPKRRRLLLQLRGTERQQAAAIVRQRKGLAADLEPLPVVGPERTPLRVPFAEQILRGVPGHVLRGVAGDGGRGLVPGPLPLRGLGGLVQGLGPGRPVPAPVLGPVTLEPRDHLHDEGQVRGRADLMEVRRHRRVHEAALVHYLVHRRRDGVVQLHGAWLRLRRRASVNRHGLALLTPDAGFDTQYRRFGPFPGLGR
mmetsp:Transcript_21546/g.34201  ORF Transcript_21546/g.34201 Transcript_21546/m.34201 type:complete len:223 (+) Transcript_21546:510-1178(+)